MDFNLFLKEDESIKDPVQLNKDFYYLYSGGQRADWEKQVNEDIEIYNGKIWDKNDADAVKRRLQPVYEINLIRPGIQQLVSQIVASKPNFRALPREDSDAGMSSAMSGLGSFIWDNNNGNMKLAKGVEDCEVTGMMILHGYISNGDFKISVLDNRTVYIDPNSKEEDAGDAAHIIISALSTKEQIQDKYPDFEFDGMDEFKHSVEYEVGDKGSSIRHDDNSRVTQINDLVHKKCRIIDRYSKIKIPSFTVYDNNTGWEITLSKEDFSQFVNQPIYVRIATDGSAPLVLVRPEDVQYAQSIVQKFGETFSITSPDGQNVVEIPFSGEGFRLVPSTVGEAIQNKLLKFSKYDETRILRFMTIGGKFYYQGIMPTDKYPFGVAMLYHNRNPYPFGDVRLTKDLQYQANKTESLLTAHQINATNIKIIIGKGQDKKEFEEKWAKAGAVVMQIDLELGQPIIVQPISMPGELYKNFADKKQQIQDILGAYSFQRGDVTNAPDTFRGTLTLDEMGQRSSQPKRVKIINAINQLFRWVSDMIPHVYTEQKMIRILMPNHADPQTFIFNQARKNGIITEIANDLSTNKFDLVIADESLMVNNKIARAQLLSEWYRDGIIKDNVPILMASGLPGVGEMIQRQDIIVQLQQENAQLQDQIKALSGQLQTTTREAINANKRTEVAKFKSDLAEPKAELKSAVREAIGELNKVPEEGMQQN